MVCTSSITSYIKKSFFEKGKETVEHVSDDLTRLVWTNL